MPAFSRHRLFGDSKRSLGSRDNSQTRSQIYEAPISYIYHSGAASLRTRRSLVGLIVSDITNPFFAEASVAIEKRLAAANYVTLLGNTSEDRSKEDRVLKTMREFPAQGDFDLSSAGRERLRRSL